MPLHNQPKTSAVARSEVGDLDGFFVHARENCVSLITLAPYGGGNYKLEQRGDNLFDSRTLDYPEAALLLNFFMRTITRNGGDFESNPEQRIKCRLPIDGGFVATITFHQNEKIGHSASMAIEEADRSQEFKKAVFTRKTQLRPAQWHLEKILDEATRWEAPYVKLIPDKNGIKVCCLTKSTTGDQEFAHLQESDRRVLFTLLRRMVDAPRVEGSEHAAFTGTFRHFVETPALRVLCKVTVNSAANGETTLDIERLSSLQSFND